PLSLHDALPISHGSGVGAARRSRLLRGSTSCESAARGAARAGPDGASRLHVPGPKGFTLRRLAGAPLVSRALGDRTRETRDARCGKRDAGCRGLASCLVFNAARSARIVGIVPARCSYRSHPASRFSHLALLVVIARNAAGAAARRGDVESPERAAGKSGACGTAEHGPVREPRRWSVWRGARSSRPAAADAARRRCVLAARSRHGTVRHARPVLVSLNARA